jgi:hypothetical protein
MTIGPCTHVPEASHAAHIPQFVPALKFDRVHVPLLQNWADWQEPATVAPVQPGPDTPFAELAHAP